MMIHKKALVVIYLAYKSGNEKGLLRSLNVLVENTLTFVECWCKFFAFFSELCKFSLCYIGFNFVETAGCIF